MIFSIIDNLKDPVVHHSSDEYVLSTFIIHMPLDKVTVEYYDYMTGDKLDYEENVAKYGEASAKTRFRCLFTSLGEVDLDLLSLYVKSVNIWFKENVIQIELRQMIDTDYSMFYPYMKLSKMWGKPDRILYY